MAWLGLVGRRIRGLLLGVLALAACRGSARRVERQPGPCRVAARKRCSQGINLCRGDVFCLLIDVNFGVIFELKLLLQFRIAQSDAPLR